MSQEKLRVLDVGQCDFDHGNIRRLLVEEFGVEVDRAMAADEAVESVEKGDYALVLVNRVLDSDDSSGLDLVARLQSDEATRGTPVMLVSNYADAQDAAVAAGAKRGFGKNSLDSSATRESLAPFFEAGRSA